MGGTVRRTVLPTGLRILTERVPGTRSVALGFWVAVGSRDEPARLSGVSHFLEHLLFKGTRRRTALDISAAVEAVGGETNAFTAKEYTCFYARVLDTHVPLAVDVLCDIIADSVLSAADVETERGVILEEIAMYEDEPSDEVHDIFARALYGDHPLGRTISGTTDTIRAMTRRQIHGFYRRRYTAPVMVVTAAATSSTAPVVDLVRRALADTPLADGEADPAPPRVGGGPVRLRGPRTLVESRDTEQAHLVVGTTSLRRSDERRFALEVLNNVIGGGMSSRRPPEVAVDVGEVAGEIGQEALRLRRVGEERLHPGDDLLQVAPHGRSWGAPSPGAPGSGGNGSGHASHAPPTCSARARSSCGTIASSIVASGAPGARPSSA